MRLCIREAVTSPSLPSWSADMSSAHHQSKAVHHDSKEASKHEASVATTGDSHPTRDVTGESKALEAAGAHVVSGPGAHVVHGTTTHITNDHTGPHAGSEGAHKGSSTGHGHTKGSR